MTNPFRFDPSKVRKDTSYEGGCRWHTYSYPLFCSREIQASGEDSADVMEALERKFDQHIGVLTESQMIKISRLLETRKRQDQLRDFNDALAEYRITKSGRLSDFFDLLPALSCRVLSILPPRVALALSVLLVKVFARSHAQRVFLLEILAAGLGDDDD